MRLDGTISQGTGVLAHRSGRLRLGASVRWGLVAVLFPVRAKTLRCAENCVGYAPAQTLHALEGRGPLRGEMGAY